MKDINVEGRLKLNRISGRSIGLLGTIKGLVSEGELVRKTIGSFRPDAVGLHISEEEIDGLRAVVEGEVEETMLSSYEKVYAKKLTRFGEVQVPPPSLVEAYKRSDELQIPLIPMDMNDEEYSTVYTDFIGGMTMVRQSLRLKSVNRKKFKSKTPEGFCLEWDRAVNRLRSYRKLERAREKNFAVRIREISSKHERSLFILEFERLAGIVASLKEQNK